MKNIIVYGIFLLALSWGLNGKADPMPPLVVRLDAIPLRDSQAYTGQEFAERSAAMTGRQRQRAVVDELLHGNIPEFLRILRPVRLSQMSAAGELLIVIIWVTPDYMAVGSDEDFLRMPLTYPSAVMIADTFECVLPTRKIVDAIYEQAAVRLKPHPLPPGPDMRSSSYYVNHQNIIEAQIKGAGASHNVLVAGHKKDVVLSNRLFRHPDRIAIYGWHRLNKEAIQPLSTVHGARYADYSHGVRLVYRLAWFDGAFVSIEDILQDPELAAILTYEGPIANVSRLMKHD